MRTTEAALARIDHALACTRWDDVLCAEIRTSYRAVSAHGVFDALVTAERLALFLGHQSWAAWDYMNLLKSVQQALAPQQLPWLPPADPACTRAVHCIVLEEETGALLDGRPASHFEFFLHAARSAGGDTTRIDSFLRLLADGTPWQECLDTFAAPAAARFVRTTLDLAAATPAERIATFALGREELVPPMFQVLGDSLGAWRGPYDLGPLRRYLDQHDRGEAAFEADIGLRLLEAFAGDEDQAGRAALRALQARQDLLDAALSAVSSLPAE